MQIKIDDALEESAVDLASLSLLERAHLACATMAKLFPDAPDPTPEDKAQARNAFKDLTQEGGYKAPTISALSTYPTAALKYLDTMLSEYDHELINSAVRIREYVKNKLLVDSENPDGKIRIRALELLGKMKDVGLFTDRVEITHKTKTDEEVEAELQKKLERYMGSALVVQDADEIDEEEEPEQEDPRNRPAPAATLDFIDSLATS
jgi:hypothetical protein